MNSPGLRKTIEIARKANMPNDPINRAIARGIGTGGATLEEVLYEAFGPGGSALVIAGITDSKNRTSNEIKQILRDNSGSLGGPNSTMWAFKSERNEEGEIIYAPTSTIPLSPENGEKLKTLIEKLNENEDTKSVFSNGS